MLILERPWTRQPQGAIRINWSNPLSAQLVSSLIRGGTRDLGVLPSVWTPRAAFSEVVTPYGIGVNTATTNAASTVSPVTTYPFTFAGIVQWPAANAVIHGFFTSSAADEAIYVSRETGNLFGMVGAVPGSYTVTTIINAPTSGGYISYICTARSATDRQCIAVHNQTRFNGASSVSKALSSINTLCYGGYYGGGYAGSILNTNSNILNLNAWKKAFSEAEMLDYLNNPWQLFQPQRIYIPTAAAAATAPTITALSAISITATSAQPHITYA